MLLIAGQVYGQSGSGYGGPAVSSRGLRSFGARGSEPTSIRPYASVRSIYDNGVVGVGLNQTGDIVDPGGLFGVEAEVGAYGTRQWKRRRLGLDYNGSYRHYTQKSYYDGSDHILGLSYTQQATRRSAFELRIMAGTTSRPVGGLFTTIALDPFFLGTTINDIFDNRAYFLDAEGSAIFQVGNRNNITLGAAGFAVRRQSQVLVGLNGQRAFMDYDRRITRFTAVGFGYQYFHVDYPRAFGEADVHQVTVNFSRQIGRAWRIAARGGAYRSDFAGIRQVTLDPVIAELLGQLTGREAFNTINAGPVVLLDLTRTMRRSSFTVDYSRTPSAGNGILLLSRQESLGMGYVYNASTKAAISVRGGYTNTSGAGSYGGNFKTYGGGTSFSYRFYRDLHFSADLQFRDLHVRSSKFSRLGTRVSAGITYSPGPIPVSIR